MDIEIEFLNELMELLEEIHLKTEKILTSKHIMHQEKYKNNDYALFYKGIRISKLNYEQIDDLLAYSEQLTGSEKNVTSEMLFGCRSLKNYKQISITELSKILKDFEQLDFKKYE